MLPQIIFAAIVGISLGYYYEQTANFPGTAVLHNLLDLMAAVVLPVLLAR